MTTYETYKDSGISWLGKIPSHWEVKRLRAALTERKEKFNSSESLIILSLLKDKGIIPYDEKGEIGNKSKDDHSQYKIARKGDLVINSMNVIIGSLGITPYDGYISPAYYAFKPNYDINLYYFNFVLSLRSVQQSIRCYSKGIMEIRLKISSYDFLSMPFPFPSLKEQNAIVDYLNVITSKIDAAISQQQKMIDLLKERKQIIINEAVTRGLNPNALMKPTGIEWLPEIPEHWGICTLKKKADIILGKMLSNNSTNLFEYICAKDVHYGKVDTSNLKKMSFSQQERIQYEVKNGDLLIVEGGAGAGGCAIYKENKKNIYIQNSIMIVRGKDDVMNEFLCYYIQSINQKGYVEYICNKATIPHFTKEKVGSIAIPVPSLIEQEEIIKFISENIKPLDKAISRNEQMIDLLNERKQILINEVVTGKIKI